MSVICATAVLYVKLITTEEYQKDEGKKERERDAEIFGNSALNIGIHFVLLEMTVKVEERKPPLSLNKFFSLFYRYSINFIIGKSLCCHVCVLITFRVTLVPKLKFPFPLPPPSSEFFPSTIHPPICTFDGVSHRAIRKLRKARERVRKKGGRERSEESFLPNTRELFGCSRHARRGRRKRS